MTDVFNKVYIPLDDDAKKFILEIKEFAESLHNHISTFPDCREISLAKTKIEEAVMWAVKGVCK